MFFQIGMINANSNLSGDYYLTAHYPINLTVCEFEGKVHRKCGLVQSLFYLWQLYYEQSKQEPL